ncbi:APC family permease [Micromonospora mirobrigensis]|uniref:Amino acid/polyamine/organocation transporter, APC superfamily (TC 2.A.3) n=1 Tax=Micromonospora mirobrigensis TaxID=262898 RepID=A0A1C4ZZQ6_9ACTN|nr:APC family permease [Micromonospora mirobrigensis]SCF38366.1 amino acid/polyamine/organocation transporter, APC superfamily (TC 2.A.3) [Micromonospora mirobrigensis]
MPNPHTAVDGRNLRPTLSTSKIVFLVVAAAAPLAAMVGTVPLAFAIGNGAGVPAMFVFAGITLFCFSVGYAAMSRRIVHAGGFYTYLVQGLGKPVAVAGGAIAIVSYNAVAIGLAGAFGYFAQLVLEALGVAVPWQACAAFAVLVVGVLGYRQIDLSARVLSLLMVAEIGVLAVLDVGILAHHGGAALPAASFDPSVVLSGGVGVAMMFAFISFIGFESAALYGEETRNPARSIPLATYASVGLIAVFYAFTSWAAVGAIGPERVSEVAGDQLGNLFFTVSDANVDPALTAVMQILLVTSLLAAMLALHNAANRYAYVFGREGVLPTGLGAVHARHLSPHRASVSQTVLTTVVLAVFSLAGLHPYTNLATSMVGLGTLGIIVLQAGAALAVIAFFRGRADRHWWRTLVAPGLGALGLIAAVELVVTNFSVLTGSTSPVINALPWLLPMLAVAGIGYALWMRANRPARYAALGAVETDVPGDDTTAGAPTRPEAGVAAVG